MSGVVAHLIDDFNYCPSQQPPAKLVSTVEPIRSPATHRIHCHSADPLASCRQPQFRPHSARPLGSGGRNRRPHQSRLAVEIYCCVSFSRHLGFPAGGRPCYPHRSSHRMAPPGGNGIESPGSDPSTHLATGLDSNRHSVVRSGGHVFNISYLPGVLLPLVLTAINAVQNVPAVYVNAARNFGLSPSAVVSRVLYPAVVPQLIVGLRITLGVAWLVVVAAEMIAVNSGLGFLIVDARNAGNRYDLVVAGMVIIGLIGLLLDLGMRSLEGIKSLRWSYSGD